MRRSIIAFIWSKLETEITAFNGIQKKPLSTSFFESVVIRQSATKPILEACWWFESQGAKLWKAWVLKGGLRPKGSPVHPLAPTVWPEPAETMAARWSCHYTLGWSISIWRYMKHLVWGMFQVISHRVNSLAHPFGALKANFVRRWYFQMPRR